MKKIGLVIVIVFGISASTTLKWRSAFSSKEPNPNYKIYALELPESVEFAGEKMVLERADLRERLDRELLVNTYWQSNMMLLLKRANK